MKNFEETILRHGIAYAINDLPYGNLCRGRAL